MKEKPILFSGEMVREILAGHKTQTRRVIKPQPNSPVFWGCVGGEGFGFFDSDNNKMRQPYQVGDLLWVRETWRAEELNSGLDGIRYRADGAFVPIENTPEASDRWVQAHREGEPWRPSIFMPRWASRITLRVLGVRVERVQDISWSDSYAEGIHEASDPQGVFGELWDSINAKRGYGWHVNPWVWVVAFELVRPE